MCVFPKNDLNETWIKARNRQGDWLRRSSLQFIDYTILLIYSVVEEGEMVNLESMQTPFFTIKKPAKYKWANCTWKPSKNQGNTQMHFLRLREESNFKLSTVSRHIIFIHFTYTMIYTYFYLKHPLFPRKWGGQGLLQKLAEPRERSKT